MEEILKGRSIKADFEAQVTAALMIQSNALIPIKLAVRLCGIIGHLLGAIFVSLLLRILLRYIYFAKLC